MSSASSGGARVLVVDDDRNSAATLAAVLRAAAFDVAEVRSARVALSVLADEGAAVVLVSFAGRGVAATTDLVSRLRRRPEPRLGGIGVVSIIEDRSDGRFGLEAESDGVLVRPFTAARLVDLITEVAATTPTTRRGRRSRPGDADPAPPGPATRDASASSTDDLVSATS